MQKRLLNVGGNSREIPIPGHYAGWEHLILDIDPVCNPDVLCDARELATLPAGQYDAIYCSHNLEHFFAHHVPRVLAGFRHVLRPDGFAEIRVPDLAALMRRVATEDLDLDDQLYVSPAGPVRVLDVIYGYAPQIAWSGVDFYAHKTGFSRGTLRKALAAAGFSQLGWLSPRPGELAVAAFKLPASREQLALLAPIPVPA